VSEYQNIRRAAVIFWHADRSALLLFERAASGAMEHNAMSLSICSVDKHYHLNPGKFDKPISLSSFAERQESILCFDLGVSAYRTCLPHAIIKKTGASYQTLIAHKIRAVLCICFMSENVLVIYIQSSPQHKMLGHKINLHNAQPN